MAALAHDVHHNTLTRPQTGLRNLMTRLLAWRTERREVAQTLRDLYRMESRDLRDLGITQYDFDAIAHGAFKR